MSAQEGIPGYEQDMGAPLDPTMIAPVAPDRQLSSVDVPPLPGIIDLAPETPVALNVIPRHTPGEIGGWMADKLLAHRAAGRRVSRVNELRNPKRLSLLGDDVGIESLTGF